MEPLTKTLQKKQLITQTDRKAWILRLTTNSNKLNKVQDAYSLEKSQALLVMKLSNFF